MASPNMRPAHQQVKNMPPLTPPQLQITPLSTSSPAQTVFLLPQSSPLSLQQQSVPRLPSLQPSTCNMSLTTSTTQSESPPTSTTMDPAAFRWFLLQEFAINQCSSSLRLQAAPPQAQTPMQ